MMNDPIVEEVHQLRKKLMAECDGDLDRLLARLREREAEDASRVVATVDEGQRRLRSTGDHV
jgi:hypothetical protein